MPAYANSDFKIYRLIPALTGNAGFDLMEPVEVTVDPRAYGECALCQRLSDFSDG